MGPFPVCTLDAMNGVLLVLIIVVIAAIGLAVYSSSKASGRRNAASLADAKADARRLIERLGGQVLNLTGADDASKQAMADASERYTAASSQIDQATTTRQAALAKESAIEASPTPSQRTPNYYPGGRVAGRPVPAGWYSEPWWKPALVAGAWGLGSVLLFDAMFSGMHGVDYGAQGFESGYGDGYSDGFAAGQDGGGDGGGWDGGGADASGFDGYSGDGGGG